MLVDEAPPIYNASQKVSAKRQIHDKKYDIFAPNMFWCTWGITIYKKLA